MSEEPRAAESSYRAESSDLVFGFLLSIAVSIGLIPLLPEQAALRYTAAYAIMLGFGALTWVLGKAPQVEEAPRQLIRGILVGIVISLPFFIIGGAGLRGAVARIFPGAAGRCHPRVCTIRHHSGRDALLPWARSKTAALVIDRCLRDGLGLTALYPFAGSPTIPVSRHRHRGGHRDDESALRLSMPTQWAGGCVRHTVGRLYRAALLPVSSGLERSLPRGYRCSSGSHSRGPGPL